MMNVVHIFFKQNSMGENFLMLGRVLYQLAHYQRTLGADITFCYYKSEEHNDNVHGPLHC